jgi:hypothetical protein
MSLCTKIVLPRFECSTDTLRVLLHIFFDKIKIKKDFSSDKSYRSHLVCAHVCISVGMHKHACVCVNNRK